MSMIKDKDRPSKQKSRLRILLFDLDGTLVDTAPDLLAALNHVLAVCGYAPFCAPGMKEIIGDGALKMLKQGFAQRGHILSEEEFEPLQRLFLDYYEAHCAESSHPYPGGSELLAGFKQHGLKIAVCTNKLQYLAHHVIQGSGLAPWIDAIIGINDKRLHKPEPMILNLALERFGCKPDEAVMIGDSAKDIKAAYALDMPSIAVTYGYGFSASQEDIAADGVIHALSELPAALGSLFPHSWPEIG